MIARAVLDDPTYQESVKQRMIEGKAPHLETLYHYYADGKPKETIEVQPPATLEIPILYTRADILEIRDGESGGDVGDDDD